MRVRLIVLLLLCLGVGSPAKAQDSEALNAARELLAIISPEMVSQMNSALIGQALQALERQGRHERETLDEIRAEFEKIGTRFITAVMAEAPALYARNFSAGELRDIAAFYRTPSGAKSLQMMPKVTVEVFALVIPRMATLQRELEAAMEDVLRRRGQGGR